MEIFNIKLRYHSGDLMACNDSWNRPRLCVSSTRRFFDLPVRSVMRNAQVDRDAQYCVSVHDRKKKYGVRIRIRPSTINNKSHDWLGHVCDNRKLDIERTDEDGHIGWSKITFYYETTTAMLKLFDSSGKKNLYVVIEAL